jgi:hypothetical protein
MSNSTFFEHTPDTKVVNGLMARASAVQAIIQSRGRCCQFQDNQSKLKREENMPAASKKRRRRQRPKYEALADLIIRGRLLDGGYEMIPDAEEAALIRACGFSARPGRIWRCPPLPAEIIAINGRALCHLSFQAAGRQPIDPLSKTDQRILAALKRASDQGLLRVDLQRKLWRLPARFFHYTLDRLLTEDRITIQNGRIYPISRAEFETKRREAEERALHPRLPTPLYTRF